MGSVQASGRAPADCVAGIARRAGQGMVVEVREPVRCTERPTAREGGSEPGTPSGAATDRRVRGGRALPHWPPPGATRYCAHEFPPCTQHRKPPTRPLSSPLAARRSARTALLGAHRQQKGSRPSRSRVGHQRVRALPGRPRPRLAAAAIEHGSMNLGRD